ncbi:MAG: MFS transporter [Firmicutes bacterium]|nr:MFS transporter [Bacillota bacterium]
MQTKSTHKKVTIFTKIMYSMGEFPFSFSATLIGFFLMIYLTNTIGISAFWAGAIIFIGILWDAITDPIIGYINDNTRSKIGRRRKYMFLFFLPMAITFLMMFSVPSLFRDGSETIKILITLSLYLLFTTFLTLVSTPFQAIINEITDDYDDRTKMMTYRMIGSVLATLLSIIIPEFLGLGNASQNNSQGYLYMGIIFAVLILFFGYSSAFSLRERKRGVDYTRHGFEFKKYFLQSWKSAPFRQVCIMYMFSIITMNFIQGNLVYFINYKLLLPGLFLPIAGGVMVLAVLFMPLWMLVAQKTSKRVAYIISVSIIAIALFSLYFAPQFNYTDAGIIPTQATEEMLLEGYQDLEVYYIPDMNQDYGVVVKTLFESAPWVYISILLLSFGFSGIQMLPFSMVPDAVNFSNTAKEKKEGAYFGIVTFVQKMGWGIGMLLTGMILNITGYLEPAKVFTFESQSTILTGQIVLQSTGSVLGITILFSLFPATFGILGVISIWKYKVNRHALKKQIDAINTEDTEYVIETREVNSLLEIENFIRLHEFLYEDDPLFVLPIRSEFKTLLTNQLLKGKYKEEVTAFNVYLNNRIVGRIWLTIFNARPGTIKEKRQGAFNFFETIDNIDIFNALMKATVSWYRQRNIDFFYGNTNPLDPDDARGILIEGFEDAPVIMCVYNKPYYQEMFESTGFLAHEDLYGYKLTLDDVPYKRYDVIEKIKKRYQFVVDSGNKKNVDKDARDIIEIINNSITDDWDMRAPEPEKVYELLDTWKNFLDFDYVKIARTKEGRPIGFGLVIPNFNEALIKIKGKWNLFSILKLLYYKNKIKSTRAMIQMVIPEYQGKGIINAIYQDYFQVLKDNNVSFIDASTIEKNNLKSRFVVEKLGGKRYKVFRLYGFNIEPKEINNEDSL